MVLEREVLSVKVANRGGGFSGVDGWRKMYLISSCN